MPGLIDGDDAVIGGEHIDLVLPIFAISAPAVQEEEGGVAFAANLADDAQSVVGADGFLAGLASPSSPRAA